jgi:hypothetical protein
MTGMQLYFQWFLRELFVRAFIKICAELIGEDSLFQCRSAVPLVFGWYNIGGVDAYLEVGGNNLVAQSNSSVE